MRTAVIGANYGDEGKGLMTDYLSGLDTLVVRFNGGAQAGHTVVTPSGHRHVFKHLGSGTLRGAPTFLSKYFLVNPALFEQEVAMLGDVTASAVYVDPLAPVTTPWDMLLNRAVEAKRGAARHGSCGLGINETVERTANGPGLYAQHLFAREKCVRQLVVIRDWAVTTRARELGVTLGEEATAGYLLDRFLLAIDAFRRRAWQRDGREILRRASPVVFEGAQGLRLDEHAPGFPHVTRSRTGLTNVLQLLNEAGVDGPLRVVYVTRAYLTRHGAGPLAQEAAGHPYGWSGPETNVTNEYQGHFRYAPLDVLGLRDVLRRDVAQADRELEVGLAVTCLDQLPEQEPVVAELDDRVADVWYASYGPTREDVVNYAAPVAGLAHAL